MRSAAGKGGKLLKHRKTYCNCRTVPTNCSSRTYHDGGWGHREKAKTRAGRAFAEHMCLQVPTKNQANL